MSKPKVLILIVSYHAEQFIQAVLNRIPAEIWQNERFDTEVLIIDDQSQGSDLRPRRRLRPAAAGKTNITVLYNPKNQGYGGNQKIGYHYAIDKGFDAVVLLHGDGQYAPEHLRAMIAPLLDNTADVVLGSRMINRADALRGKMPFYKWIGNQILTFCQNRILGSNLAEFHTGYRAFRVSALASIPFERNSELLRLRHRHPDPVDGHRQALQRDSGADVLRRGDVARERHEIRRADRARRRSCRASCGSGSSRSAVRLRDRQHALHAEVRLRELASVRARSRPPRRHRLRHRLRARLHGARAARQGREDDLARSRHRRVDARAARSRRSRCDVEEFDFSDTTRSRPCCCST